MFKRILFILLCLQQIPAYAVDPVPEYKGKQLTFAKEYRLQMRLFADSVSAAFLALAEREKAELAHSDPAANEILKNMRSVAVGADPRKLRQFAAETLLECKGVFKWVAGPVAAVVLGSLVGLRFLAAEEGPLLGLCTGLGLGGLGWWKGSAWARHNIVPFLEQECLSGTPELRGEFWSRVRENLQKHDISVPDLIPEEWLQDYFDGYARNGDVLASFSTMEKELNRFLGHIMNFMSLTEDAPEPNVKLARLRDRLNKTLKLQRNRENMIESYRRLVEVKKEFRKIYDEYRFESEFKIKLSEVLNKSLPQSFHAKELNVLDFISPANLESSEFLTTLGIPMTEVGIFPTLHKFVKRSEGVLKAAFQLRLNLPAQVFEGELQEGVATVHMAFEIFLPSREGKGEKKNLSKPPTVHVSHQFKIKKNLALEILHDKAWHADFLKAFETQLTASEDIYKILEQIPAEPPEVQATSSEAADLARALQSAGTPLIQPVLVDLPGAVCEKEAARLRRARTPKKIIEE